MSVLRMTTRLLYSFNPSSTPNILVLSRHYSRRKEIIFFLIQSDGIKYKLKGETGGDCTILDCVRDDTNLVNFGVCGGVPECTTCHIIFHPEDYKRISKPPDKVESDVLLNAPEVGPYSRLGCHVPIEDFMDGIEIMLPSKIIDRRSHSS